MGEEEPGRAITLTVPEMDCPSCAGKVERSVRSIEGVATVSTRPVAGTVRITYAPAQTDASDLTRAVEGAGYPVEGESAESGGELSAPAAVWRSPRAIKTGVAGIFLVLGLLIAFPASVWNAEVLGTPLWDVALADLAFAVAIVVSGIPIVREGITSARHRNLDIDLLMGAAIVAATGVGLFVEAATLAVLFSTAELLERYAMDQTRDALRGLIDLAPEQATVLRDSEEVTVPAEALQVDDVVVVRPGDRIPVDGRVREGASAVDQSPITGESVPVEKDMGDDVYAGTLNDTGYLEIVTEHPPGESTLATIIELVRSAEANRTEREQFVDRFASYYTPAVVVLALVTAALPPLLIDGTLTVSVGGFSHAFTDAWRTWFVRGLTLLVIACPCAFVISTPVSVASGITAAARNGVLIKGGNHLETMGAIEAVAFDKTGTLTTGALEVTDVVPVGEASEADVLRQAAALERQSGHPIASAIVDRAEEDGLEIPAATDFASVTGRGVEGTIDGRTFLVGNPAFFAERGARTDGGLATAGTDPRIEGVVDTLEEEGRTVVLVGTPDAVHGAIGIADGIRPGAARMVERLHALGVEHLVMLTGDNEGTARHVAAELGLDDYRAELLPEEKVDALADLEDAYGTVAMVGDGVNDAPALARASVGIAMGAAGTDAAIETADIALMGDDIRRIPYLYALSQKANGVIRQNIWISLGVKLVLAVGVPFGYVTVAVAVLVGDMGMSLGVTGNAMRLARITPERFRAD